MYILLHAEQFIFFVNFYVANTLFLIYVGSLEDCSFMPIKLDKFHFSV